MMDDSDREVMQGTLRMLVGLLRQIPAKEIEAYAAGVSQNNSLYDAIGPIVDPTEYRARLHSGGRDNLRIELQIVQRLLEARQLIDQLIPPRG